MSPHQQGFLPGSGRGARPSRTHRPRRLAHSRPAPCSDPLAYRLFRRGCARLIAECFGIPYEHALSPDRPEEVGHV